MNKYIRAILAVVVLAGIVLLGRSGMAWAGTPPFASRAVPQSQGLPAAANAAAEPGSVRPPPIEVVIPGIAVMGDYSVGGICTVHVLQPLLDVSLTADLHPFDALGEYPQEDIGRYLGGVCHLTYLKDGVEIPSLPAGGDVHVCFAAIPSIAGDLHVFDGAAYHQLDTWAEGGLLCADVPETGFYFLAAVPQT